MRVKGTRDARNAGSRSKDKGQSSIPVIKKDKPAPLEEVAAVPDVKEHNIKLAATGCAAYIAIGHDFYQVGTIQDWIDATIIALDNSKRPAVNVTCMNGPETVKDVKKKAKSAPALIAKFETEHALDMALGPIDLFGRSKELAPYRGGNSCTFKMTLGPFMDSPEVLLGALAQQASVKITGWGYRTLRGTIANMVVRTQLPPGRSTVSAVIIGKWRIPYERIPGKDCCCCGMPHDCFLDGTECVEFRRG